MSFEMREKLLDNGLTNSQLEFLQSIRRSAQFTLMPNWEKNIHIALDDLKV